MAGLESAEVPAYTELPVIEGLAIRHSWGLLPRDHGALSFLSTGGVRAAAAEVHRGEQFSLNLSIDAFDPPLFGRRPAAHRVFSTGRNEVEDTLDDLNPQASSQLDGLAHVRAREAGFYGGIDDLEQARAELGIHHWAARGIVGRGVCLDVARYRQARGLPCDPFEGYPISAHELQDVADAAGTTIREGDILLVRTGWVESYMAAQDAGVDLSIGNRWAGLAGDEAMAEFVWDHRLAAVGADNPAVEDAPGSAARGSLHRRLIPGLGVPLFELLNLGSLATRLAELDRASFMFVSVPLAVPGGVSSTANALAIV